MRTLFFWVSLILAATPSLAAAPRAPGPIQVMIVAVFHMNNPGRDIHSMKVADVLAPAPQAQIAVANAGFARFHPTRVMVEWPAKVAADRYAQYRSGTLPPSRDESVQLGFRLAKTAGLSAVEGVDVDGDFPYEAVQAYAAAHGQTPILDAANARIQTLVDQQSAVLTGQGVGATLHLLNDPARIRNDNDFYRQMLKVGGGSEQPGADLLTTWYHRNFLICANILQLARPGDRIAVFFGAGHAFLLRQCVSETPGFRLVEANDYLSP